MIILQILIKCTACK